MKEEIEVTPIGRVESSLDDPKKAPKQGAEGGPEAWMVFDPRYGDGLNDLRVGTPIPDVKPVI